MADDEEQLSKEQIDQLLHFTKLLNANIPNWKYVLTNAEYLDKKQVSDALEQTLVITEPLLAAIQVLYEIMAIQHLEPKDFLQ